MMQRDTIRYMIWYDIFLTVIWLTPGAGIIIIIIIIINIIILPQTSHVSMYRRSIAAIRWLQRMVA